MADQNDKLRRLCSFLEELLGDSDRDIDHLHPKQVGMRLAWNMACQEIDRLLAEDEPETPGDEVLRAVLGFPDPEASEDDGTAYVPSILALKELCRRALEKP